MKTPRRLSGLIIAVGLTLAMVGVFYSKVLRDPNSVIFDQSGDGFKNYYTPAYHVKHDSSYVWFGGMNYPWGEHVTFTDCQPLVSNSIKLFSSTVTDVSDYTVGILNLLMLLGLVPCAMLLWAILTRLGVGTVYAGFAAAGITMLTPQIIRFFGHYALSYAWVIPLVWWLHLKQFDQPKLRSSLLIAAVVFLCGWIHPYFLSIAAFLLMGLWGFRGLMMGRKTGWKPIVFHGLVQAVLPVLLFQLSISLTDPVKDRPANPYGIIEYKANVWNLVLPYELHFFSDWDEFPSELPSTEGTGYLGITAIVALCGLFIRTGWRMRPRRIRFAAFKTAWSRMGRTKMARRLRPSLNPMITISLLAAFAVLALSFAFPFSLKPNLLVELFPPIKQFRSLGRFVWVFYYVWGTFTFYLVWALARRMRQRGKKMISTILLALPLMFIFSEGVIFNLFQSNKLDVSPNELMADHSNSLPENEWVKHIKPDDYSALLFLPYFHVGSENLGEAGGKLLVPAFKASLETGLPLMNVMMSRTSLTQTWRLLQMVSPGSRPLEISNYLNDARPILVVQFKEEGRFMAEELVANGKELYANDRVRIFSLRTEDMKRVGQPLGDLEMKRFVVPDTLYTFGELFASRPDPILVRNDFEGEPNGNGMYGKGGLKFNRQNAHQLHEGKLKLVPGQRLLLSTWARLREDALPTTLFGVEEKTVKDSSVAFEFANMSDFIQQMDSLWALCEREYTPKIADDVFKITIVRWKVKPQDIVLDEFLMRDASTHLMGQVHDMFYYDNRFYKVQSESLIDSLLAGKVIVKWK
jgi:hypothetical protein